MWPRNGPPHPSPSPLYPNHAITEGPVNSGLIHVSGDVPPLPWVRSRVWVGAGLGLGLREGRAGTSPETSIDPKFQGVEVRVNRGQRESKQRPRPTHLPVK